MCQNAVASFCHSKVVFNIKGGVGRGGGQLALTWFYITFTLSHVKYSLASDCLTLWWLNYAAFVHVLRWPALGAALCASKCMLGYAGPTPYSRKYENIFMNAWHLRHWPAAERRCGPKAKQHGRGSKLHSVVWTYSKTLKKKKKKNSREITVSVRKLLPRPLFTGEEWSRPPLLTAATDRYYTGAQTRRTSPRSHVDDGCLKCQQPNNHTTGVL